MSRFSTLSLALLTAAMPLVLDSAFKGVALLVIASVAALALWRASSAARHLVWLVAVLALLLVPVLSVVLPGWRVLPDWAVAAAVTRETERTEGTMLPMPGPSLPEAEALPQMAAEPAPNAAASPALPVHDAPLVSSVPLPPTALASQRPTAWLPLAWGAGCLLLLLRLFSAHWLLRRASRHCQVTPEGKLTSALAEAAQQLGIRQHIRFLLDGKRTIPVVWGVIWPRLILPAEAQSWDDAKLRSVLLHELAHIRRRDTLVQWLTQLACSLHWFNPLVWLAAWRLHTERERACDDLVLASGVKASAYAGHLLEVACKLSPARWTSACGLAMARKSSLESRLRAVLSANLNRRGVTRWLSLAVLVLGLSIAIPLAMLRAANEKWNTPQAASIIGNEFSSYCVHDGKVAAFVIAYQGQFGSSSDHSANSKTRTWYDDVTFKLKGTTGAPEISSYRAHTNPDKLTLAGKEFDLNKGRVFVIDRASEVRQFSIETGVVENRESAELLEKKLAEATDTQASNVGHEPVKGNSVEALLKRWDASARADGKIPGGCIGQVAAFLKTYMDLNAGTEAATKCEAVFKKCDATNDWLRADAAALLEEVETVCQDHAAWTLRAIDERQIHPGKPLPDELKDAPWGTPAANGLRMAWLCGGGILPPSQEPATNPPSSNTPPPDKQPADNGDAQHVGAGGRNTPATVGTILTSRVLFNNTGNAPICFATDDWIQSGTHSAKDAIGKDILIHSTSRRGIRARKIFRLAPGEYAEVVGHGIGIGSPESVVRDHRAAMEFEKRFGMKLIPAESVDRKKTEWYNERLNARGPALDGQKHPGTYKVGTAKETDIRNVGAIAWIEAKEGDVVTFTPGKLFVSFQTWQNNEGRKDSETVWNEMIAARVAQESPWPATMGDRELMLKRIQEDLGIALPEDLSQEILKNDTSPDCLDKVTEALVSAGKAMHFAGELTGGETKFAVTAAAKMESDAKTDPADLPKGNLKKLDLANEETNKEQAQNVEILNKLTEEEAKRFKAISLSARSGVINVTDANWTTQVERIPSESTGPAPKHEYAQALFKQWRTYARADGKIPGALIGHVAEQVDIFLTQSPADPKATALAAIRPRFDATHDWTPEDVVALMDAITEISTAPIGWASTSMEFAQMNKLLPGKPLPEELHKTNWGKPAANGLRAAYVFAPSAPEYPLNTVIKPRVLFHNTGTAPVIFRTETWHQNDNHRGVGILPSSQSPAAPSSTNAHDPQSDGTSGRNAPATDIPITSTWFTGITPTITYRLAPGEYAEVSAHGIAIGAGKYEEEHSTGSVGAVIEAIAGQTVRFSSEVNAINEGWTRPKDPKDPTALYLKNIADRIALEAPLPKSTADRELLITRAMRELFGEPPSAAEVAMFTTDVAPDALEKLTARLHAKSAPVFFSGKLPTGETTFKVLPADTNAANTLRTATGPGRYLLGNDVHLQVTQTIGEGTHTNKAEIIFLSPNPKQESRHKPHAILLPDEFSFAWQRGSGQLWLLKDGFVWRYSFTGEGGLSDEGRYDLWPPTVLSRSMKRALLAASGRATVVDFPPLGDEALEQVEGVQQLKQMHLKLKPETVVQLAWGPAVNGLRVALIPMPGAMELKPGAVLDHNVVLQNVSETAISVRASFPDPSAVLFYKNANGQNIEIQRSIVDILSGAADVKLEPQEIVVATLLSTGIGRQDANIESPRGRTVGQWFTPPAGQISLSCRLNITDPFKNSLRENLRTGEIKLSMPDAGKSLPDKPKTSDNGPRQKVDWSKFPVMDKLANPYDPEVTLKLAAEVKRSKGDVRELMVSILQASAEKSGELQPLLQDEELKRSDDEQHSLALALAAYDYSLNANPKALQYLLNALDCEPFGGDPQAVVPLGYINEWDATPVAQLKHFCMGGDGASSFSSSMFWNQRKYLYPEQLALWEKQKSTSPKLDTKTLRGVWKGIKNGVSVELRIGEKNSWEIRHGENLATAELATEHRGNSLVLTRRSPAGDFQILGGVLFPGDAGTLSLQLGADFGGKPERHPEVKDLMLKRIGAPYDDPALEMPASGKSPVRILQPETAKKLSWGNAYNGLRAALSLVPPSDTPVRDGGVVDMNLVVQNVSDAPIRLRAGSPMPEAKLHFTDPDGMDLNADMRSAEFSTTVEECLLKPNEIAVFSLTSVVLGKSNLQEKSKHGRPIGQRVQPPGEGWEVWCEAEVSNAPVGFWTGRLKTGVVKQSDPADVLTVYRSSTGVFRLGNEQLAEDAFFERVRQLRETRGHRATVVVVPDQTLGLEDVSKLTAKFIKAGIVFSRIRSGPSPSDSAAFKLTPDVLLGTWRGMVNGEKLMLSFHRPPAEKDVQLDVYFGEATIGALARFTIAENGGSAQVVQHTAGGGMEFGTLIPDMANKLKLELYGRQQGQQELMLTRDAEPAVTEPKPDRGKLASGPTKSSDVAQEKRWIEIKPGQKCGIGNGLFAWITSEPVGNSFRNYLTIDGSLAKSSSGQAGLKIHDSCALPYGLGTVAVMIAQDSIREHSYRIVVASANGVDGLNFSSDGFGSHNDNWHINTDLAVPENSVSKSGVDTSLLKWVRQIVSSLKPEYGIPQGADFEVRLVAKDDEPAEIICADAPPKVDDRPVPVRFYRLGKVLLTKVDMEASDAAGMDMCQAINYRIKDSVAGNFEAICKEFNGRQAVLIVKERIRGKVKLAPGLGEISAVYSMSEFFRLFVVKPDSPSNQVSPATKGAETEVMQKFTGESLKQVLEANPNDKAAHYNLAVLLALEGKLDLGKVHYERAVELGVKRISAMDRLFAPPRK